MTSRDELLAQLTRGEAAVLHSDLRGVLGELRALGFQVVDVHVDAEPADSFEIIVDRPIPRDVAGKLSLPQGVEVYEDYDQHDSFVGMGFICTASNQCINGRWRN